MEKTNYPFVQVFLKEGRDDLLRNGLFKTPLIFGIRLFSKEGQSPVDQEIFAYSGRDPGIYDEFGKIIRNYLINTGFNGEVFVCDETPTHCAKGLIQKIKNGLTDDEGRLTVRE